MLKNPVNLKSLTVNLILSIFKQCSHVQIFFFFLDNKRVWIALKCYEINSRITKLDLFKQTIFDEKV